ncbi:MAG: hypothetical protein H6720_27080, partial [Sandaracinus sp.]|nr:hypothetical protein [Sandaracinus sp.]
MQLRLSLLACLALVACGDDDHDHHHGTGSCGDIVSVCHDVDPGTGPISDCHATGHDGDEAACDAVATSCVALCAAA